MRIAAATALCVVLAVGCGSGSEQPGVGASEATASPDDISYSACSRRPAPPGSTHLRASTVPKERTVDADSPEAADVTVEDGGALVLSSGRVGSGNGYEAATGGVSRFLTAATGAVTAHAALAVWNGPRAGRRVAFVELTFPGGEPVSWTRAAELGITTDGGDGGFAAPEGPSIPPKEDASEINGYIEAFFPGGDSASGNVCVQRHARGRVDALLFSTGFGDGRYPAYVGRDGGGKVVSVVHHGGIVPWSRSGLPGRAPV